MALPCGAMSWSAEKSECVIVVFPDETHLLFVVLKLLTRYLLLFKQHAQDPENLYDTYIIYNIR